MPLPRPFLLALPVAAGALAWVALTSDRPPAGPADLVAGEDRRATPPPAAPPGRPPAAPLPPPEPPVVEDPEWATRDLPSLRGTGPLKGGELVAAVEKAGPLRFRGRTAADLDALRGAVLEDADRDAKLPYAAMMGWLKEAGFEVEVTYPTLTVSRRPVEEGAGR